MKTSFRLTCMAIGLLLATSAFSQISSIGPFTGTYQETFDEFPNQQQQMFLPNPTPVFGGHGSILTTGTFGALAVYNPPDHPFGNYQPHDGSFFAVTQYTGDVMTVSLDSAMDNFGGYWGQDPLHVAFFDANNNLIGQGDYSPATNNDGVLQWLGWHLDSSFTTVQISPVNDTLLIMDSWRVGTGRVVTPEPFTMGFAGCGALLYIRRRRRTNR